MKKVLILNKNGFIGSAIHEGLSSTYVVGGVSESGKGQNTQQLDISDKYAVNNFFQSQSFDVIVYCPEIERWETDRKNNEENIEQTVEQTKNIIDIIKNRNTKFIYISTKDVYGGNDPPYKTDSARSPVNHRGKAYLQSEYTIQKHLTNYCIIRPGKVYGFVNDHSYDPFTQRVLSIIQSNRQTFDDEVIEYPTFIDDLMDLVRKVIDHDLTNNYNISSRHGVTNYEWAKLICEIHNINDNSITPMESTQQITRPYNVKFNLDAITDLGLSVEPITKGIEIAHMQSRCTFRPVYIQNLGDRFGNNSVSSIRNELGTILAERDNIDADVVVPIPQSGVYPASGYANTSSLPLKFALSKQNLRHRTLYDSSVNRGELIEDGMQAISELVEGKIVVLVDEALLSGTTVKSVVPKLDVASEIHVRISSPPVVRPCPAGVYPDDTSPLIKKMGLENEEKNTIEEKIAEEIDISSIKFIPTNAYREVMNKPEGECVYCFK